MKRPAISLLLLLLIISSYARANVRTPVSLQPNPHFVSDEVLIKFKAGISETRKNQIYLHSALSPIRSFPTLGIHHLRLSPSMSVEEVLHRCGQDFEVEYVEPNFVISACQTFPDDPPFDPGDPMYGILWGLHNFGQTIGMNSGLHGADIDAPEAWEVTRGAEKVTIAVIDTGIAYSHPDLAANMWINPGEDPWSDPNDPTTGNGIDDDKNGRVDDWRGWDFVDADNDPMDFNGHGTHVAGTVGAVGNNGTGISGVMWRARVMPLRSLNSQGIGTVSDAISAIRYATQKGARIINASWGMGSYSRSLLHALESCQKEGVLVVAAAGNSAANTDDHPFYPASYGLSNIISVAATGRKDSLASFSNWGPSTVDVAAPGVSIYSTWRPFWRSIGGSFPDDVESGAGDWKTNGTTRWDIVDTAYQSPTHSWTDSPLGDYENNADSWLIPPRIDLSGRYLSKLTFYLHMETERDRDFLSIEGSTDGTNWTAIPDAEYTGYMTGSFAIDISVYDGQPEVYVRFHLVTDSHNTADGVYIDDVDVTSISHRYEGDEFQFLQGTSMAAPHVSGLAGLVLAQYPTLTWDHLRWRILNGADEIEDLAARMVTGGRINANNSLRLPSAPTGLSASRVSEGEIALTWIDASVDEEGFTVERKERGGVFEEVTRIDRNTTSYSDTNLPGKGSYTYRIKAFNTYGDSGYSNEAKATKSAGGVGPATADGGGSGGCFIATAAYGSPRAGAIHILRSFRDRYLIPHPIGRKSVDCYYRYSPPIAVFIADRPAIRRAVRIALHPLVFLSAVVTTRSIPWLILILAAIINLLPLNTLAHKE
jgi:subtilisin family serine protease